MGVGFKKIQYNGSEEIFETIIRDGSGMVIGKWKCMKRDFGKVIIILKKQYGLNLYIKDFNYKPEPKRDKDLDWAL